MNIKIYVRNEDTDEREIKRIVESILGYSVNVRSSVQPAGIASSNAQFRDIPRKEKNA